MTSTCSTNIDTNTNITELTTTTTIMQRPCLP